MADKKIKILSCANNNINLNFMAITQRVVPLIKKSFCYITEDELTYLLGTSKAFEMGIIKLAVPEDAQATNIDIPVSPNALTDADIDELLKKTQKQLAVSLEDITNIQLVNKILAKARELNKSVKTCDLIQSRLDVLMSQQM